VRHRTWLVAGITLATVIGACAQPGMPPGGPIDKEPPQLMAVTPESGAVNVRANSVLLRFNEVVNERSTPINITRPSSSTAPATDAGNFGAGNFGGGNLGGGNFGGGGYGGGGSTNLGALVLLSPGDGRERVSWRRHAIEIEPRGGFKPNTTYRITLLPGLSDLRGNVLRESREVVFSTGASIPTGAISGVIFDWAQGTPARGARIEVFTPDDTTTRWRARSDEMGRFVVRDLEPGDYLLRGWLDENSNRVIDPREIFDGTPLRLDSIVDGELYAFAHDTIGPRLESVEPLDSTALRVRFDRPVAPTFTPDSTTLYLMTADSVRIRTRPMMPLARWDSLAKAALAARLAAEDSIARSDTTKRDTTAQADTAGRRAQVVRPSQSAVDSAIAAVTRQAAGEGAAAGADTTTEPPPMMKRPVPVQVWVMPLDTTLTPGTYRVRAIEIEGLAGAKRGSEREFKIRPPAKPDSTKADSTASPTSPTTRPPTASPTRPSSQLARPAARP
jgi:hypothetical protein